MVGRDSDSVVGKPTKRRLPKRLADINDNVLRLTGVLVILGNQERWIVPIVFVMERVADSCSLRHQALFLELIPQLFEHRIGSRFGQ
jgi:hypothetical protein